MPQTNTVTRTFNAPPDPIGGRDRFNLAAAPNEYVYNVRIVVTQRNAASATLVVPTRADLAGSQQIVIAWALAPVPGSKVSYRVDWEVVPKVAGRAILFEHINFSGEPRVISDACADLVPLQFNDRTSSLIVLGGAWMFFSDINFQKPIMVGGAPVLLGPGQYNWVEQVGIGNDSLSSLRAV